jgi:predicted hydrocarbon binding protein
MWEATVYLEIWLALEEKYGRDAAKEICAPAMYEAGVRFGRAMADQKGRNDLAALKETWEELYPTGNDTEWDGKRLVFHNQACVIRKTFEMYGLEPDLYRELAQVFCEGDRGFVNGFNPEIRFTWGGRIFRDEPECRWVMEATE